MTTKYPFLVRGLFFDFVTLGFDVFFRLENGGIDNRVVNYLDVRKTAAIHV